MITNIEAQMQNSVLAEGRFLSKEMVAFLNDVVFLVPNWKWIGLAIIAVFIFVARPFLQMVFHWVKQRPIWEKRYQGFTSSLFSLNIESPIAWIITLMIAIIGVDGLGLTPGLDKYIDLALKVTLSWHVVRLVYITVDALGVMFLRSAQKTHLENQLIPFAIKSLKVLAVIMTVLIALQNFGVNVTGMMAGLGLGGLAFALAAQDTVANIFGSITILLDKPFKVGDWIKIGETEGNVEEIGFRSTRIRTFYNSLVSIPNSIVAKDRVDNRQVRKRRRIQQTMNFSYQTVPAKLDEFCQKGREILLKENLIDRDVTVTFNNFSKDSLDVLVQFFMSHATDADEQSVSQRVFLALMQLADSLGIYFADLPHSAHWAGAESLRDSTQVR